MAEHNHKPSGNCVAVLLAVGQLKRTEGPFVHFQVCLYVHVRGRWVLVTQPQRDDREVNASLKQVRLAVACRTRCGEMLRPLSPVQ